jgi:inhibitor of KinA
MSRGRLVPMGDSCLSVMFDEKIDPAINARCVAIAASLEGRPPLGLRDVVPSYHAVTVHFDPLRIDRDRLVAELTRLAMIDDVAAGAGMEPVRIPVKYGGEWGPDLADVAAFAGCSEQDVIRLHSGVVYRVFMLGFLPGFAYLGSVDSRIAMPRLDTPRLRVLAGSVGIAGRQTGIYPCDTPGGWRIVGRTKEQVFDPARADPCLLKAGDSVTFVAV